MNKLMITLVLAALVVIVAANKPDHSKQHQPQSHNKQPDVHHQSQGHKQAPHQAQGHHQTQVHHQAAVHHAPAPVHGHGNQQQGHGFSQSHGQQHGGSQHGGSQHGGQKKHY